MKRLINYINRWNAWRKCSINSFWYKLLVLIRICRSPSFEMYFNNTSDNGIFIAARGNGKSRMALESYRQKIGIPDDVWEEMKREVEYRMFGKIDD